MLVTIGAGHWARRALTDIKAERRPRMRPRVLLPAMGAVAFALTFATAASAVTPGWECIPTTAGQAVVSGGTGVTPACGAGSTAVLAPTLVSSGVGGEPT